MENMECLPFGDLLKGFRKQRDVSQKQLATLLDVHRNTIGAWERGDFLPECKSIVLRLACKLHLNECETRQLLVASLTAPVPYWYMPYQRNPLFVGREKFLGCLHRSLALERAVPLMPTCVLSGPGGIGKTQAAIEYAYRYAYEYTAVFWIVADTYDTMFASFETIAKLLDLPERLERDQCRMVSAIAHWLSCHRGWLLIFDNVEDISAVKQFLPLARQGAILLTTRIHTMGTIASRLQMPPMGREESVKFLLWRARYGSLEQANPVEHVAAQAIVRAMDCLPLALDRAGSYIEETRCSLVDFLHVFRACPTCILSRRTCDINHPQSVTETFNQALSKIQQCNSAAAELLMACAFLAPEAIPEAFLTRYAAFLGPTLRHVLSDPLRFNATLRDLLTYSLLERNAYKQILIVPRLVQIILRENLKDSERHEWCARVLRALNQMFPIDHTAADYWFWCKRLLPHALECIQLHESWNDCTDETSSLLRKVATYLSNREHYDEVKSLYLCAQGLT